MSHFPDNIRASYEHLGCSLSHEDEIRDCRGIYSTSSARAKNYRDLGDDSRSLYVAEKDIPVSSQGINSFLDAGTTGIIQANNWGSVLDGQVHDPGYFFAVDFSHRTPKHCEVLCVEVYGSTIYLSLTSYDSITVIDRFSISGGLIV